MTRRRITRPRGYSLTEFVMAAFVTSLLIMTLIAMYVTAGDVIRRGAVQTWAQQQANYAISLIGDTFRPAVSFVIYSSYASSRGEPLEPGSTGTYCTVFNLYGITSAFYFANSRLYFVTNEATDTRASSSDDVIVMTDVDPAFSKFTYTFNMLDMSLRVLDPRDTSRTLFSTRTQFTPRNLPID